MQPQLKNLIPKLAHLNSGNSVARLGILTTLRELDCGLVNSDLGDLNSNSLF